MEIARVHAQKGRTKMSPTRTSGHPRPWSASRPIADTSSRSEAASKPHPAAVAAIKTFHTLAWLSIESCVVYVLYKGVVGRTDRRVGMAAAVIAGESLVFAGNGFRCPLTQLAKHYGAESGAVTDIHLPKWFAEQAEVQSGVVPQE
jgi:hypothetical protein